MQEDLHLGGMYKFVCREMVIAGVPSTFIRIFQEGCRKVVLRATRGLHLLSIFSSRLFLNLYQVALYRERLCSSGYRVADRN